MAKWNVEIVANHSEIPKRQKVCFTTFLLIKVVMWIAAHRKVEMWILAMCPIQVRCSFACTLHYITSAIKAIKLLNY